MKTVDAVWEIRNLGVSCYELTVGSRESAEDIADQLSRLERRQYMVAKVPSENVGAALLFQDKGFRYIETLISLDLEIKELTVPARLRGVCGKCSSAPMDERDILVMENETMKGIFRTDRVSADPYFPRDASARRYIGWMHDLAEAGCIPRKVIFGGADVGFFIDKRISDTVFDGLLAGVYSQYEGSGMGFAVQYAAIVSAAEAGASRICGHVSGNNPAVLRILTALGYRVKSLENVFIKHESRKDGAV